MKIEPKGYGILTIKSENDAESLWLGQWLDNLPDELKKALKDYLRYVEVDNNTDSYLEGDECGLVEEITIINSGL